MLGEDSVDRLNLDVSAAAEGIEAVRRRLGLCARGVLLQKGSLSILRERNAARAGVREGSGQRGDALQGGRGKRDQGRRRLIRVKTRGSSGVRRELDENAWYGLR